jgi:hypothetical protein
MRSKARLTLSILLIVFSLWWIFLGSDWVIGRPGLLDVEAMVNGSVPLLLIIVGSMNLWVEADELRFRDELRKGNRLIEPALREDDS